MIRKIIQINEEKCNGCGACVIACHEEAIGMVNNKATLLRDDYCDGLGDCLPACPMDAIKFVEREAAEYDEVAVHHNMALKKKARENKEMQVETPSEIASWPVQLKLAPVKAPYFEGAKLLIAADCTAYAYGSFHQKFMRDRITLIGCPKLDSVDYSEKLCEIIKNNDIKDVTLVRMEVPCCGGLEFALKNALKNSGKMIPWQVVTISTKGEIL